jgi:hypothetical protein
MWINQPDREGYWLFVGTRITRSKNFVTQIAAPCRVSFDKNYPEPIVYYCKSGAFHGLTNHHGRWYWLGELLGETENDHPIQ